VPSSVTSGASSWIIGFGRVSNIAKAGSLGERHWRNGALSLLD
jgi:hypothetical protein